MGTSGGSPSQSYYPLKDLNKTASNGIWAYIIAILELISEDMLSLWFSCNFITILPFALDSPYLYNHPLSAHHCNPWALCSGSVITPSPFCCPRTLLQKLSFSLDSPYLHNYPLRDFCHTYITIPWAYITFAIELFASITILLSLSYSLKTFFNPCHIYITILWTFALVPPWLYNHYVALELFFNYFISDFIYVTRQTAIGRIRILSTHLKK